MFKVPQPHYPSYYLCAVGVILSVLLLIPIFPSPVAVALSFRVNKYMDAVEEYEIRRKELKEYSFEESGYITRPERRGYLEAPKRDYDEIFIEIKIENVGKRVIERFALSLENSETGYDKSWSFKSGLYEKRNGMSRERQFSLYPVTKGTLVLKQFVNIGVESLFLTLSIFHESFLLTPGFFP